MSTDYGATVEEVFRAFSAEEYWLARLADSGADDATLDSMQVGGPSGNDGSIDVITTQVLRSDRLPGLITQFPVVTCASAGRRNGRRSPTVSPPQPLAGRSWTRRQR